MKNENGITILALVITIVIMTVITFTVFYTAKGIDENVEDDVLLTELETVHHIVLQEWNKKLTLGTYTLDGTPVENDADTTAEEEGILKEQTKLNQGVESAKQISFKRKPTNENRYYEYFKLTPADLKLLGAKNATSDYLVCYETGEVANITKYKTSDGETILYTK